MKKNKLNLILLFVVLSLLVGCNNTDSRVDSESKTENVSVTKKKFSSTIIDGKIRESLLKEIVSARELPLTDFHDIGKIQSFYCLDGFDFTGYELSRVMVFPESLRYFYAPKADSDGQWENVGWFEIIIFMPVHERKFDVNSYVINGGIKTKDGFAYDAKDNTLTASINDDTLRINAPQSFPPEVIEQWHKMRDQMSEEDFQEGLDYIEANQVPEEYGTYEFLRDLAFRIIKSAELVTVE